MTTRTFTIVAGSLIIATAAGCEQRRVSPNASAETPALGATRLTANSTPSTVSANTPTTLVMTPVGPIDATCAHELPNGATVDFGQGNVLDTNGSVLAHYDPCPDPMPGFPQLPSRGSGGDSGVTPPNQIINWVESSQANSTTYVNSMTGDWQVPGNPSSNDGQLIFLFFSLQSSTAIIQPVIQYGSNGAFGGYYWTMATWLVYENKYSFYTTPVTINVGDSIQGEMVMITGSPQEWYLEMADTNISAYSYGETLIGDNNPFSNADQAVLEAYQNGLQPTTCAVYPGVVDEGSTDFGDIQLTEPNPNWNEYKTWSPSWETTINTQPVTCNWNVIPYTDDGTEGATLDY